MQVSDHQQRAKVKLVFKCLKKKHTHKENLKFQTSTYFDMTPIKSYWQTTQLEQNWES